MVTATGQGPAGPHLVLYDGVCGLCNRLVQFLLEHDREGEFALASLQSGVGRSMVERFGGDPDELTSFYVITNYRDPHARLLSRSRAALFVADEIGWPWRAAGVIRVLPTPILNVAYDLVARYRYRVFGRFEECPVPRPEDRRRFLDV